MSMNTNDSMSQVVETNKTIIKRYFEAYNTKNEAIFDEIIGLDYIDHGQSAYMGSPGRGVAGAKNDLKNSLDKLDDFSYVIEAMIASESLPDLVGTYWKGSLTPKASPPDAPHNNKIINYRGVSIYRIQNGKMIETWHVIDGLPSRI
jgi:predicted ester cyclase